MSGNSTASVILVVAVVGVLLFIVPLVTLEGRVDNVTQQKVQQIIEEATAEVANTGVLTRAQYQDVENRLAATGKTYDLSVEAKILDENPGKKQAQANYTKIGENVYFVEYTTQVLPQIGIKTGSETVSSANDTKIFKPGDIISFSATSQDSVAQDMKGSFLGFSNAGEEVISASSSAMCTVYGTK